MIENNLLVSLFIHKNVSSVTAPECSVCYCLGKPKQWMWLDYWSPWTTPHVCCHVWLCSTVDCSLMGSSVHSLFLARILGWVAISSSSDLPDPGIEPTSRASPALAGGFFVTSATRCYKWKIRKVFATTEHCIIFPNKCAFWVIFTTQSSNQYLLKDIPLACTGASPVRLRGKEETACQCRRHKRCGFDPWVGKIPWRRAWKPTLVFFPGESHEHRSLAGYSP